ncbi:hypothetical protein IMG5_181530 [Ichthyophthirius multifiliis]|uniref:Uncharacterized protein n=1 Tax=Ichthyophthirius multifiliis TaxID=5932 RepID=G0R2V2_ICHMU|nr:hypothetical protein IMG5_181530 [Ichthyophthirius multifiliis]EGR28224.1 hypothetical protein IMG5_181530 [Ichthyophthirius multifiliis]|eukprot:XP_004027569.1 hypothetical protein IMG5_181530 [Ichthyophthirius multifiliis]
MNFMPYCFTQLRLLFFNSQRIQDCKKNKFYYYNYQSFYYCTYYSRISFASYLLYKNVFDSSQTLDFYKEFLLFWLLQQQVIIVDYSLNDFQFFYFIKGFS